MTALELYDEIFIKAKNVARNQSELFDYVMNFKTGFKVQPNASDEESWISINNEAVLLYDLGYLSELINNKEQLFSFKNGDKVDTQFFFN